MSNEYETWKAYAENLQAQRENDSATIEELQEALARVEAERDGAREALIRIRSQNEMLRDKCSEYVAFIEKLMEQRDTAQAQLAEAVGALEFIQGALCLTDSPMVKARINMVLARLAQDEQQEAEEYCHACAHRGDNGVCTKHDGPNPRAALSTQNSTDYIGPHGRELLSHMRGEK